MELSWISAIQQDGSQTKDVQWQQIQRAENRLYNDRERKRSMAWDSTAIQRRVADAQAAGVHPLFALGAAPTNMPTFGAGVTPAGGGGGGGISAPSKLEIEQMQANTRLTNAQANLLEQDFIEKSKQASDNARLANKANITPSDWVQPQPDKQISAQSVDQSVTAGKHPGFREYVISGSGLKMDLPYSEEGPGEALENIPWYLWPVIIQHNRAKYGDDWGERFYNEFMQNRPALVGPPEKLKMKSTRRNPDHRRNDERRYPGGHP